jgi:uncharacterized RDD family membrane protein YckC
MPSATQPDLAYADFWVRAWAAFLDTVLLAIVIFPMMSATYGNDWHRLDYFVLGPLDLLFTWILPAFYSILFWKFKGATPGKMAVKIKIVDASTGNPPTLRQLLIRYLASYLSLLPLGIGYIWADFDPRRQAWHDKLACTVVVLRDLSSPET